MERILFVGSDLRARARLEGALRGWDVEGVRPDSASSHPVGAHRIAVVDLDEGGVEAASALRRAGFDGRVVGFFSHVDEALGTAASDAGIEAYPRGRFWRELEAILAPPQSGFGSS